jgi:hypothetical protein
MYAWVSIYSYNGFVGETVLRNIISHKNFSKANISKYLNNKDSKIYIQK